MTLPNNRIIFDMNSTDTFERDYWVSWYWRDRPKPKLEDHLYTRSIDPSRKLVGWIHASKESE